MANTLRIKRSVSTNTPTTLAQGELAYSEDGSPNGQSELFIGTAGSTVTKITTDLLTGTDGVAAQPNTSAQDNDAAQNNQTITSGLGIDGADAGDAGNITLTLATTELSDVAPVAADQFVFNDDTDETPKKQVASSIPISLWGAATAQVNFADQDLNRPVLEDYGVKHQVATVSTNAVTVNLTLGNSALIDMDPATAAVTLTLSNPPASGTYGEVNLTIVMGTPAYDITWPGTVTWLGGGTPPTLTSTDNVVDIVHLFTIDGGAIWYGTVATAAAADVVESVTSSTGITVAGTATNPTVAVDYLGTDNFIDSATDLESTAIASTDTIVYHDATDSNVKKGLVSDLPFGSGSGDISRVDITAGTGLTGSLNTVTGDHIQTINAIGGVGITASADSLDLDFSELTDMTGGISGTTEFILQDGTTESRKAASEIALEFFNNAVAEFVSENDTLVVVDWNWVLDEDAMGSNSATHLATQQSIKAYVDTAVTGALTHKGGYNAATNTPALDTGSPTLEIGDMYTVTAAGTFFTVEVEIGDVLISDVDSTDAANIADWTIVQSNIDYASETVPGYIEIADQSEVDSGASALLAVTPSYLHNTTFDGGTF
jgi:hypothetical protein